MSSTATVKEYGHVKLEFEGLEFHRSRFKDGEWEKEEKRTKRRSGSKKEDNDLEKLDLKKMEDANDLRDDDLHEERNDLSLDNDEWSRRTDLSGRLDDLSLICTKKGTIWVWSARQRRTEMKNRGRTIGRFEFCRKKNAGSEWMWGRRSKTRVFKTRFLKVKLESYKLEFHVNFLPRQLPPLTNRDLKTRVSSWNSSFRHLRC